jgi:hypothetical protein
MAKTLILFVMLTLVFPLIAQEVLVSEIVMKNMQEDGKSKFDEADEIVLLQAIFDVNADSLHFWELSPIYQFSDSISKQSIKNNLVYTLSDSLYFLLALIEVDNETQLNSSNISLQNNFIAFSGFPNAYIKNKLISHIGNNQILCFYYDAFENFPFESLEFNCTGLSIFNKFEYKLQFQVK